MSTWPHFTPVVTVCDVLDAGACIDGVKKFVEKVGKIAGSAANYKNDWIRLAANADGYGDGSGSGSGYGDGSGYG